MIGTLLQPELEELIREKKWEELKEVMSDMHPADIAAILVDVPDEHDAAIFRLLPRDLAGQVFSYLPRDHQKGLCHTLSHDQMRKVLDGMTPDDQVRLLDALPGKVTRKILSFLPPDELNAARDLLGYPVGTAGRYMTPEYVRLKPEMTARAALIHVRSIGKGKETLNVLYIVDSEGKLLEDVKLGSLVLAPDDMLVNDIHDTPLVAVKATDGRDEVIATFEKYDRTALPVVDDQGKMLGIITIDDVLDAAQQRATEEIQRLGGSEALDAPYLTVGFWDMVKKRGGWLMVLFLGEMLTATAMGYFEGEIEKAAVVALFVPLIISSGGNSGSQGTSLIIRSLALKEIRLRDWWRVFGREIRTGLALGLLLGIIGFMRIGAWQGLSHVPHVGAFFQTHSSEDAENIPEGMKLVTGDTVLAADLTINNFTLPKGSQINKGMLLPADLAVPADVKTMSHSREAATAYGKHWFLIGLTVFFSLIGVITWGSLAGSMLPFILRSLGFDPATSSAPFVATLVDVTGLIIYFITAKIILTGTLL